MRSVYGLGVRHAYCLSSGVSDWVVCLGLVFRQEVRHNQLRIICLSPVFYQIDGLIWRAYQTFTQKLPFAYDLVALPR